VWKAPENCCTKMRCNCRNQIAVIYVDKDDMEAQLRFYLCKSPGQDVSISMCVCRWTVQGAGGQKCSILELCK